MSSSLLHFPPFRLDPSNERLWRETLEIPLRPKTFAVLRYLVEHPEQLVTKEELMDAVWAETVVGEDALTGCIRDLRKVLGDEAKRPQYIETVHRRGFRFIAPVAAAAAPVSSSEFQVPSQEEERQTAKAEQTETETEKTPPPDGGLRTPDSGLSPVGSLDEAQRNPGEKSETETRISLRSIRATEPESESHTAQPLDDSSGQTLDLRP